VSVTELSVDEEHPDSTFVEDTALLAGKCAVVCRPGATERRGETELIEPALRQRFSAVEHITAPGTVDGGDVLEADDHFLIGISERTNDAGARQLANILTGLGFGATLVDIRGINSILHLKSGVAYLGDGRLAVSEELALVAAFKDWQQLRVKLHESYAANCVRINDQVLIAAGFPEFESDLRRAGYSTVALEMSEFQKMDGGLSCLSLRY
jgi:dimethylargininase